MTIIEKGLHQRILDVQEISSNNEDVKVAEADFDKYYAELQEILGVDHPVLLSLEEATNNLRYFETEAAYRVGLSDGMQLQLEINAIMDGGRK